MKKKLISIILCITLLFLYIPSITAASNEKISETIENSNVSLLSSDIPENISSASVIEKQHIERRYDLETDLHTAVFENADGKNTAYIFSSPIKYVDESGNIKDKSTKINAITNTSSKYAYAAEDNNIKTFYPATVKDGIALSFDSYSIEFYPYYTLSNSEIMSTDVIGNTSAQLSTTTSVSDNRNTNRISYNSAFGANTSLQYTPTLTGVKEDIILNKYTGVNEFHFIYKTNGISLIKENNTVYLTDANNVKLGQFGYIICYDSNKNISVGTISVNEIKASQQYMVTVSVNESFLTSSTTAYPVYIDPTITIYEYDLDATEESDGIIKDKGIYKNSEVGDYLSTNMINVGPEYELADGDTRMLFALTDEYVSNSFISTLDENNFCSAALNVYTQVGDYNATVTAYQYNQTWLDGTVAECTEAQFDNYIPSISNTTTLNSGTVGMCAYDITNIVGYWVNGSSALQSQGLILINANEGTAEDGEYLYLDTIENPAHTTYITIDYGDKGGEYYLLNKEYGHFLTTNSSYSLTSNTYAGTTYQKWVVNYIGDNKYTIASAANENKLLYYTGSTVGMAAKPSVLTTSYQWTISAATGGMIIKNVASNKVLHQSSNTAVDLITTPSSTSTDYDKCVWRTLDTASFVNLTNFSINASTMNAFSTQTCSISTTPYNATLKNASDFTWSSSNSSVISVSETGVLTSYATGGSATITAVHKATGISRTKTVSVSSSLTEYEPDDGLYFISNASDNEIVLDYDTYIEATIIKNYTEDKWYGQYIWYIKQQSAPNKTYLIYSMSKMDSNTRENNQVLTYNSGGFSLSAYSGTAQGQLWKFYKDSYNNIYIESQYNGQYLALSGYTVSMSSSPTLWALNRRSMSELDDHCYNLVPTNYQSGNTITILVHDLTNDYYNNSSRNEDVIGEAIALWNNVSSNINVVLYDANTYTKTTTHEIIVNIKLSNDEEIGEDAYAGTSWYSTVNSIQAINVNNITSQTTYARCDIFLNIDSDLHSLSYPYRISVIAHEIGHVLTLKHIDSVGDHGVYAINTTMLSIMNYTVTANGAGNKTYLPSWLDKENIQMKWGY